MRHPARQRRAGAPTIGRDIVFIIHLLIDAVRCGAADDVNLVVDGSYGVFAD